MSITDDSNCSVVTPNVTFMLAHLTKTEQVVLCFEGLTCIFLLTLLSYDCFHFNKRLRESPRLRTVLFIQSTFVFYASTSFLAVISPRSSTLTELVFTVYFSFTLKELLSLMIDYLGGDEYAILNVNGAPASLAVAPCACMCCWCCPRVYVNRKYLFWIKVGVYQTAIIHTIIDFISAFLWTNNLYAYGVISLLNPSLYLKLGETLSILLAMYALTSLYVTTRRQLKPFHITGKFACVQMTLVISGFQGTVFSFLVLLGVIKCKHILSAIDRATVLHHFIVVPEMLILYVASRYFHTLEEETDACSDINLDFPEAEPDDEQTNESEPIIRPQVPPSGYEALPIESHSTEAV